MGHVILSDALAAAVEAIETATTDPFTARCYVDPKLAAEISTVRDAIDNLRNAIDQAVAASTCEDAARIAIKAGAV